jgi:cellulose synthase/poly-beta-1,6-N-acetylglucosamine synthase-like glycosyltransferase
MTTVSIEPRVSVVVPTCERPVQLERCLAALAAQSLPREEYEVIVVDDACRAGPAAARNRGWRRARAPIVAFTADDSEPEPDWLKQGLAAFGENVDAVCGSILAPLGEPADRAAEAEDDSRDEFSSANCFCRKSVLDALGGFDADFKLPGAEDADLHLRLLVRGSRIVREPSAMVFQTPVPAGWDASLRQQKKAMFDALLYRKHRGLYRERVQATPRWDYYATVGVLLIALGGVASGAESVAESALVVWGGLTAQFALRRLRGSALGALDILQALAISIAVPPVAVFWRVAGALRYRVLLA